MLNNRLRPCRHLDFHSRINRYKCEKTKRVLHPYLGYFALWQFVHASSPISSIPLTHKPPTSGSRTFHPVSTARQTSILPAGRSITGRPSTRLEEQLSLVDWLWCASPFRCFP